MLSTFLAAVISLSSSPQSGCEAALTQRESQKTIRLITAPHFTQAPEVAQVKQMIEDHLATLDAAGFPEPPPFDVVLDFENGFSLYSPMTEEWMKQGEYGPQVIFQATPAINTDGRNQALELSPTILSLPLHSARMRTFSLRSSTIAHELGHIFEPAALHEKARSVRHGQAEFRTWQEARAMLIDFHLTGHHDGVVGDGAGVDYSLSWPTYSHIRLVGHQMRPHALGQMIGHVIFAMAQDRPREWLVQLLLTMDRKIAPGHFSRRNGHDVRYDVDPDTFPLPEHAFQGVYPEHRTLIATGMRASMRRTYNGMAFVFEKFLDAAKETGATTDQIAEARKRMKKFGFPSQKR